MRSVILLFVIIVTLSCAQSPHSGSKPSYDYKCFKWTEYGDILHYRPTFNDSRFEYFTGHSYYSGRQNGVLFGHRDSYTGNYFFAILFDQRNHTALFQFDDFGVGSQMSVKFPTNQTSLRFPSDATFQWVPCSHQSQEKSASQISFKKQPTAKDDFYCMQNSRWLHEKWYFIVYSELKRALTILGYDILQYWVNGHVAGFYDKKGSWTLMTMYPQNWHARFFIFDKIPSQGIDYSVEFANEGKYIDYPWQVSFRSC